MARETVPSSARKRCRLAYWLVGPACALLLTSGAALADPIVNYSLGTPPGTAVFDLAPGADGAMWFVDSPTDQGNQFEVARMDPSGTVSTRVQLDTGGARQGSTGASIGLAPAGDGGVWVEGTSASELVHVSPAGVVKRIALPAGASSLSGVVAGRDGNAWTFGCSQTCALTKVDSDGGVTSYPLPSLQGSGAGGYSTPPQLLLAVEGGIWVNAPTVGTDGSRAWRAAFVTYAGHVTPTPIPNDSRLLAAGGGDKVWWQQPADPWPQTDPIVTFGQVSPAGPAVPLVTHQQQESSPLAFGKIAPGRNGTLLWALGTPTGPQTAYMGTITEQGETRYAVGQDATAVPPPTPFGAGIWSGTCSFGVGLFQARNGDIWVNSSGSPGRLSVLSAVGSFSTFLPVPPSTRDSGVGDMEESSTGDLWLSVNMDGGSAPRTALLARANPLSPPPGLPVFPRSTRTSINRNPVAQPLSSSKIRAWLKALLSPPTGRSASIRGLLRSRGVTLRPGPLGAGSATIKWYVREKGVRGRTRAETRRLLVAEATVRFSGTERHVVRVQLTSAGRLRFRNAARLKVVATGTFSPAGGRRVTISRVFRLSR